jgi:c-di-GMP-binding flagellar brake protein YcgR
MINFDDKRDFYRIMLNSEVIVTIIDDEANSQITATCRDLSATGMAIEMEHPLAMSTQVKIKLYSASELVQDLYVRGKVVRIDEEYEGCYLVGIYIEEID